MGTGVHPGSPWSGRGSEVHGCVEVVAVDGLWVRGVGGPEGDEPLPPGGALELLEAAAFLVDDEEGAADSGGGIPAGAFAPWTRFHEHPRNRVTKMARTAKTRRQDIRPPPGSRMVRMGGGFGFSFFIGEIVPQGGGAKKKRRLN